MNNSPINTKITNTVIIGHTIAKQKDHYLLVKETNGLWYFPAGRIENTETLLEGVKREVLEEANIEVEIVGLINIIHRFIVGMDGVLGRFDLYFEIKPTNQEFTKVTKNTEDTHTQRAEWFKLEEIKKLQLRTDDVVERIENYELLKSKGCILPINQFISSRNKSQQYFFFAS